MPNKTRWNSIVQFSDTTKALIQDCFQLVNHLVYHQVPLGPRVSSVKILGRREIGDISDGVKSDDEKFSRYESQIVRQMTTNNRMVTIKWWLRIQEVRICLREWFWKKIHCETDYQSLISNGDKTITFWKDSHLMTHLMNYHHLISVSPSAPIENKVQVKGNFFWKAMILQSGYSLYCQLSWLFLKIGG